MGVEEEGRLFGSLVCGEGFDLLHFGRIKGCSIGPEDVVDLIV
jgi:hypothetical protein